MPDIMQSYTDFLETKRKTHKPGGFECTEQREYLFPFQNFVVNRALHHGKYAVFSGTGTGKTRMELAWCDAVVKHTHKPVLILAPLAVTGQTIKEGEKIGVDVKKYGFPDIQIANYEQLDNIDLSLFSGICLDESSILKNFEGKYRNALIEGCKNIQYKLCGTATPSPNDEMELGNHSEFLNVMSRLEMLAMYFVHDAGKTQEWRLKGHARKAFYEWVASWAVMFQNPKDIGFKQDGYDLPMLNLIEHKITTTKRDNGKIFNDTAVSATNFNAELRLTKVERLEYAPQIVNASKETFIIWIKQNEEGELLRKLIPDAIEVKGSDTIEFKEKTLLDFADGKVRVLITKSKIAGAGMNFQNCHNQIFASLDFSFEGLFQSIRRSWRFGQLHAVNIYIVTTDTMENVIQSLQQKEKQFEVMQAEMTKACTRMLNVEQYKKEKIMQPDYISDKCHLMHGDSVQRIKDLADESVGFSIFSPPFAELYTYSDAIEDMGNSKDYKEFLIAFKFLVSDLFRILWSGRNVAVHCMDLPIQKGKEGYIGLRDFSGMIIDSFCGKSKELQKEIAYLYEVEKLMIAEFDDEKWEHDNFNASNINFIRPKWLQNKIYSIENRIADTGDFIYHSRVTIWKNPVTEMQRTKALGLLHKQIKKDAAMSRVGIPDYLLVFRKPGVSEHPIAHTTINVDTWQKYASPVWMDIDYSDTLNGRPGREQADEKHIAPLQLETIRRAIHLWSNENDTVFTPFLGIGSEVHEAIKLRRKGIGCELKGSYFEEAVRNCKSAEQMMKQQTIMDLIS